jgi:hypothetical protein
MKRKWQGGSGHYWRHYPGDSWIDAVKVTCCNEAEGPDNLWLVEKGSYPISSNLMFEGALSMACYPESQKVPTLSELVHAFDGYCGIDRDSMNGESYVQLGAKRYGGTGHGLGDSVESDYVLHGNADLERFIRYEFLD